MKTLRRLGEDPACETVGARVGQLGFHLWEGRQLLHGARSFGQMLSLPNLLRKVLGLGNGIDLNNASKGCRGELRHVKLEAKLNDLTHLDASQWLRQFLWEAGKTSHDIGQKDVPVLGKGVGHRILKASFNWNLGLQGRP